MPVTSRLMSLAAFVIVTLPAAASAQWLEYPTAGVPRTADGKPNLTAPAPRTTDGEPDLSGMWGWETARCALQRFSVLTRVHQHRRHAEGAVAVPAGRRGARHGANRRTG
jgi:hypothetical protein